MFLTRALSTSGLCDVENEQASWLQSGVNTAKEPTQLIYAVGFIEQVIEALTQRRYRNAARQFSLQQRTCSELGIWHSLARNVDHLRGNIYSEDIVSVA